MSVKRAARLSTLLSGALVALLAGLLLCSTAPAASSMIGPSGSSCSGPGCASTAAANGEGEEGEGSEEGEVEEDAASAEASAEESGPSNPQATNSGSSGNVVVLSRLRLTSSATTTLKHRHPSASAVRFSFTLNAPAKLHVTLVKLASGVGTRKKRWTTLPDSFILSARQGRVERSLTGHNRLSPGRYRLTVKPTAGNSRSIYLSTPG